MERKNRVFEIGVVKDLILRSEYWFSKTLINLVSARICHRCGRTLGLNDARHIICEPPDEEINRAKEELAKEREYVPVKAYAVFNDVCDFCYTDCDKLLERFFFNL